MTTPQISIDYRMVNHSGIGVYLKNITERIQADYTCQRIGFSDSNVETTVSSDIYSIKEHIELPFKAKSPQLFFAPHFNLTILPLSTKHIVTTIHDVFHFAFSKDLGLVKASIAQFLIKNAIRKSDRIITVSEFSKNEIRKYTNCSPEKISVIHNGINHQLFQPKGEEQYTDFRNKYTKGKPYLLFVGNIKPHKNIKTVLNALPDIADMHLLVVGKQEGFLTGETGIQELLLKLDIVDRVHFTGYLEEKELPLAYGAATTFIFPSRYEGFGLPPLEAMAMGVPVIASDIPVLREVCGDNAKFFETDSASQLADLTNKLVADTILQKEMGVQGKNHAAKFTWEKSWNEHKVIFDEYIQG